MPCPKIKPSSVSEQICLLKFTPLLNVTGSYDGFYSISFCRLFAEEGSSEEKHCPCLNSKSIIHCCRHLKNKKLLPDALAGANFLWTRVHFKTGQNRVGEKMVARVFLL